MSTSKRRGRIQEEDNLLTSNPNSLDPKTADAIGFGLGELALDIEAADSEFQAIEAISIHSIVPNSLQPRYAIPHTITDIYQEIRADNMAQIFERWIKEIHLERTNDNFSLEAHLLGEHTARGDQAEKNEDELTSISTEPTSNIERSFMKIVDLAASIRRDGLSNPISLVRQNNLYEIETGERRWLAYHLLYLQFGDSDILHNGNKRNWSRIPARVVREVDVWRQASENNARDNLNAISKARQLALLLMDLHGWENFVPYNEFENEQDFYAQVSDGREWRIPRGQGERLLNAMGLTDASQLRQYRSLLRLPNADWRIGDDENLTEGELRKLQKNRDTVTRVTVTGKSGNQNPVVKLATDANNWRAKLRRQINKTDEQTREELRNLIEDEINELNQIMDELNSSN
jgi:hypothetical protein